MLFVILQLIIISGLLVFSLWTLVRAEDGKIKQWKANILVLLSAFTACAMMCKLLLDGLEFLLTLTKLK